MRNPAQVLNMATYVHKKRDPGFEPASQGDVVNALHADGLTYIAEFLVKLGVDVSAPLPPNPGGRVGGSHLLPTFYQKLDASLWKTLPGFRALPAYQRIGLLPLLWQVSSKHSVSVNGETSFLTGYALVTEADISYSKVANRLGALWNTRLQKELDEMQSFEREGSFGEAWLYKAFPRAIEWLDGQLCTIESLHLESLKWLQELSRGRPFTPLFEPLWLGNL